MVSFNGSAFSGKKTLAQKKQNTTAKQVRQGLKSGHLGQMPSKEAAATSLNVRRF
jgi:hypothetical protein